MFKNLIVAGALSLAVLGFGTASQALAGTNVDIGIGLGGGYSDPGRRYRRVSCREGARIVASAGFRRVRPLDCNGSEYAYRGFRHGDMYKITIKSRNGHIKNVIRLRRGGGWDGGGGWGGGGYDDGYDGGGYDDGGYDDGY